MSELRDFIETFSAGIGDLPLVHTTDKFTLQLIRQSKKLEPADDKIYSGERLVYMFYGRPSFRVHSEINRTAASFFAPVCLVFDRTLLNAAHRIMPFDSGAHASGLLEGTIHKQMKRENFELEVHPDSPLKLIKCFYGSEDDYLENNPKSSVVDIGEIQKNNKHYVEAHYHLVHYRSNTALDDRVNAVEIQFNKDIALDGNLKAVIIPSRFFTKELVISIESELGATAILYDMPSSYKPAELMNTIYEKVHNFIMEGKGSTHDK